MIARLSILISVPFYVPLGTSPTPVEFERQERRVRLHPPVQSTFRAEGVTPPFSTDSLRAAKEPVTSDQVKVNDTETVACDLLRVDFIDQEFDRSAGDVTERHQLIEAGFAVANQWLVAYRVLLGAHQIKPVTRLTSSWRLDYLDDGETRLPKEHGLISGQVAVRMEVPGVATVIPASWDAISAVGHDYVPSRWDELLVDATELLPAIGPAVLLAYTALEIRIAAAADVLAAESGVHADLWTWLTEKRTYLAEPTTEEFAKEIFRLLTGKSLADDNAVWNIFTQLRKARNSFAHEGIARGLDGTILSVARASELVVGCRAVLDWIDALLPENSRRPTIDVSAKIEVVSTVLRVK